MDGRLHHLPANKYLTIHSQWSVPRTNPTTRLDFFRFIPSFGEWTSLPESFLNFWSSPGSLSSSHIAIYTVCICFRTEFVQCSKDGTKATTRIKKIKGDQDVFIQELRAALQIPFEEPVKVRVGGTVEIPGNRARDVREWLAGLGF